MTNTMNLSQHKHLVQTDQALRAISAYLVSQLIKAGVVDADTVVRDLEEIEERLSDEFAQRFGCQPTPNFALTEIIQLISTMGEPNDPSARSKSRKRSGPEGDLAVSHRPSD